MYHHEGNGRFADTSAILPLDDEGRALASGVYLYQAQTNNAQRETRKLVLER